MKILQSELNSLKLNQEECEFVVKIGGFVFPSRDHLLLWCHDNLPGVIPVGCFVDVYTFLNRMLDSATPGGSLHHLVDQHKLGLSGDDALTLESFQIPTPKMFGPSNSVSAIKSTHRSWIGTMPNASSWEDPRTFMGIRDRLRKQISNIKSQVQANINFWLSNHPVGRALAVSCLEATISFINSLSTWITDTHQRLTSHGYSSGLSWQLVTQVIYYVFTSDLDKARNFVRDGINTNDQGSLHGSILWGLFRTHHAMEDYMEFGLGDHPAVASQYLNFLVDSKGEESDEKDSVMAQSLSKLETKADSIEKLAKEARSAASTTANGLDQLKTKVANLSRNQNNGGGGGD